MKKRIVSGLIFILMLSSCGGEDSGKLLLKIRDHTLHVEVADTPEKREQGLMNRKSMGDDEGMLFIFEKERRVSFWMKNTEIPLSVAYISKSGHIREIHELQPHSLEPVTSSYSILYALEVNRGYFRERGIEIGDQIEFP